MSKLLDRIRKGRESTLAIDKHTVTIIRPTVEQMVALKADGYSHLDLAKHFVVGWAGVTEADIIPAGASEALPFEADVWREWLADHPEWWSPIGMAVVEAFNSYSEYREDAAKN